MKALKKNLFKEAVKDLNIPKLQEGIQFKRV